MDGERAYRNGHKEYNIECGRNSSDGTRLNCHYTINEQREKTLGEMYPRRMILLIISSVGEWPVLRLC